MSDFSPANYGPTMAALIDPDRLNDLGDNGGNSEAWDLLSGLTVESAFLHQPVADREMAKCCISGLWLHHDFLHESHELSQDIHSTSGSYWHGIMHRREGDFSNAKYWFRNAGDHPAFEELPGQIAGIEMTAAASELARLASDAWDAAGFVDLCRQAVRGNAELVKLCQHVARLEWQCLFDFCYDQATT
ncbi:MAG: hypothetical protein AAF497_08670 [Planctomycetota bacterium]